MTRTTTLIATGLTTLALSACGTAATTSPSSVKPAAPAIIQTASQAHTGYFNMTTLAAAEKRQFEARMSDPTDVVYGPRSRIASLTCIQSGAQSATCLTTLTVGYGSNGATVRSSFSRNVTISADGSSFISHRNEG